ncbi:ZYRO0G00198p [Zygosaccharomyces rouxii]|uniref:ZYRO0G00198p n=1 Tax=Zygosaccharomyces rouxii (strain ATCC 2623 / CBS 732 / NBRC 1130 / NCYC 568 / NRRL Y-229) TaxID=559307 RepID=C5E1P4_ZYGRC|nr:uncharacterized protein ZYRO0G00198g [Zygosaccharomyces rouxii]KAH9202085.1 hypothetical protein LQ764DRAFT_57 [Zygosaccharomyces rouxii]CAR29087.1 ZYRO0G00198p [Zygosaccharomyces rouxii]
MRKVYEDKLPISFFKNLKQQKGNVDPDNLFDIVGCVDSLRGFGNDHARIAHHLRSSSHISMKEIISCLLEDRKKKQPYPIS